MTQGFNWESHSVKPWWTKLVEKVDALAAAGITDVWLPPPSQSVDQHGMYLSVDVLISISRLHSFSLLVLFVPVFIHSWMAKL